MKRILIAYASKTGTAAQCAERLREELRGQAVTVADLEAEAPCVRDFDAVIVGSSVRFGKLRPAAARFLHEQEQELASMPHGLFLCCGFGHEFEVYSEKRFSRELRASAFAVLNFGGKLKLEKASLFERLLLHSIRSSIRESELDDGEYTPTLPGLLPENISLMADALRRSLG